MICYLGIGANLGERAKNIRLAIEQIKKIHGVEVLKVDFFIED